VKNKKNWGFF